MKDTHVLAAACCLALIAIVGIFIGYATDTLPQHRQRVIITSPAATDRPVAKKKDCHCCQVTPEDIQERLKEIVNVKRHPKERESFRIRVSGELQ